MSYAPVTKLTFYGDSKSGNCLKARWVADSLRVGYDWVEIDVVGGETQTEDFLAMNPIGKVPYARWPDGRELSESNSIMIYLAESCTGGERFLPRRSFDRAQMMRWLFWEQYSHETAIAVRRYHKHLLGKPDDEIDPGLLPKGRRALGVMQMHLMNRDYFVAETLSLADVGLVAYTRWAHEGGFDVSEFPAVDRWVRRVERDLGLEHARNAD